MSPTQTVRRRSSGNGVVAKFLQYLVLKDEEKTTTGRISSLKKELTMYVVEHGEKDEKGHRNLILPTPVEYGGKVYEGFQQQRRVSQSFDDDTAEKVLKAKGLYDKAVVMIPQIDQNAVYVLNQEGLLTDAELDSMFSESETFAFRPLAE
jgi:hypothetical protein